MSFSSILSQLRLNQRYVCTSQNGFQFWDEKEFKYYNSSDYLNSEQKEIDEFYRMHEAVLLHLNSGIRFCLLSSEDYTGNEVTYILCRPFIITKEGIRKDLIGLDILNEVCYIEYGQLKFNEIKKN